MENVPEMLEEVTKYGFYVWNSPAMKAIGKKSYEFSSKNTFKQDEKKARDQVEDYM